MSTERAMPTASELEVLPGPKEWVVEVLRVRNGQQRWWTSTYNYEEPYRNPLINEKRTHSLRAALILMTFALGDQINDFKTYRVRNIRTNAIVMGAR